jgi:teichuronic acid biosynthesis glycosyltransferase TuaC
LTSLSRFVFVVQLDRRFATHPESALTRSRRSRNVIRPDTVPRAVRVLIVTHMWPTEARPEHGAFVRDQVEALRREPGVEVELVKFPPGWASYLRAAWSLRGIASRDGFDVVHAHYGLSGWSALAARARCLVVTFHGTDLRHRLVGPLSRLLARVVTLPATVSAALAREALAGAGTRRRIAVLPCGVDVVRFRVHDRREARARLGLDRDRPYLLFPADPARSLKRYDRARAIAARADGAELLTLRAVVPSDVPLWVNAANAVLVTSEREGFGLAALEALACNVPVLSTPVGVAPVVLAGLPGTLCAPYDRDRWLEAVRPHLDQRDPRIDGRPRAELFSTDRMARRVVAAYLDLIATGE